MAGLRREREVTMPADRLFHARLGHSAKVSSLSDLEYRVWTTYVLAADDFGVMRADAVAFQAAHDALRERPAEQVAACVERLVDAGLVAAFEHQGARYLYQADWQDFQRVRFPGRTLHPLPAEALVSARTRHLWSIHPGGARLAAMPESAASAQLQKFFRTTSEALQNNCGTTSEQLPHNSRTTSEAGNGPAGDGDGASDAVQGGPERHFRTTAEVVPNNFRRTSEELPSHARACQTANGLWLREEGGVGGEGPRRQAKASLRGGGARSTEPREAYDAGIKRAKR